MPNFNPPSILGSLSREGGIGNIPKNSPQIFLGPTNLKIKSLLQEGQKVNLQIGAPKSSSYYKKPGAEVKSLLNALFFQKFLFSNLKGAETARGGSISFLKNAPLFPLPAQSLVQKGAP